MTPDQLKEFSLVLMSAFPDRVTLARMVQDQVGVRLESIAAPGPLKDVVFALLQWAESQQRLDDLLKGARQENPHNEPLRRFYERTVEKQSACESPQPAATPVAACQDGEGGELPASIRADVRLRMLLRDLFTSPLDLHKFFHDALGREVADTIDWQQDFQAVAFDVVERVSSRGLEAKLLSALAATREGRRRDIEAIASALSKTIASYAPEAPGSFHVLVLVFERLMSSGSTEIRIERTVQKHLIRFAERHGIPLSVSADDIEAPLALEEIRALGRKRGADLVIWGDSYEAKGSIEIDLRWALVEATQPIDHDTREGATGALSVPSLSRIMEGYLLEDVDYVVVWTVGMREFTRVRYDEAAEFFECALRIAPGNKRWMVRFGIDERGFQLTLNRPYVHTLLYLALSYMRGNAIEKAIPLWDLILQVKTPTMLGDILAVALVTDSDPPRAHALLAAACLQADAYRLVGRHEEALAKYRHVLACAKRASHVPSDLRRSVERTVTRGFHELLRALLGAHFGERRDAVMAALQRLVFFDGMRLSVGMVMTITELAEPEYGELWTKMCTWGALAKDAEGRLVFEALTADALRDRENEADALRGVARWLGASDAGQKQAEDEDAVKYLLVQQIQSS